MTNLEIKLRAESLVIEEQRLASELIELIALTWERQAYFEFGFSSLFDWLVSGLKYSRAAAQRRIDAARLLRRLPEVKEFLESCEVTLSTLSQLQCAIRAEEKLGEVTNGKRAEALGAVKGLSGLELDLELVKHFPAFAAKPKREVHRVADDETIRCSMNLSKEAFEDLKRLKEVLSHQIPSASDAEAIAFALKLSLEMKDKAKPDFSSDAEPTSKLRKEKAVHQKYEGKCCYQDPESGEICGSTYQVEVDHIIPKAKGGTDDMENLRLLCKQHNLLEAERHFGKKKMKRYRKAA